MHRTTSETDELAQMSLATLVAHCRAEGQHYSQGQPYDACYAYELCRRALVERCELAWAELYYLYTPLVQHWVRRSASFATCGESEEFFVTEAFFRFSQAITPQRFAEFPSLAALMGYLRRCTSCVVIDFVRSNARTEQWFSLRLADDLPGGCPEEQALGRLYDEEFWHDLNAHLHTEAERVIIRATLEAGMSSGEIYNRWRGLFSDVNEVYTVKRNMILRLKRSPYLRRLAS
ncbi:MAG: sigma-70 family RNA polymerase sigma factor [Chloroflexaceae bacterium]|jgi:DNA-directed RNA polymerase specialized sigma24 family protein|nr:sigma-70 family RNA polymerase sigma factor [Chloroflexaceae bacterium]